MQTAGVQHFTNHDPSIASCRFALRDTTTGDCRPALGLQAPDLRSRSHDMASDAGCSGKDHVVEG